jgi:hypothetical protein
MKIEVSIGEAIDKLSILEIKFKRILNECQKIEIQKEITALQECLEYKNTLDGYYYKLLMYVNEKIWDMTDVIKNTEPSDPKFADTSNQIFTLNQKRFRLKSWFNVLSNSNLKEQKSYQKTHCQIIINDEELLYDKISEINYLCLEYDVITFESVNTSVISSIFKHPNIFYEKDQQLTPHTKTINLEDFNVSNELKTIYEFTPVSYISGGMIGDLIHNCSVINENFYKSGRKGILYISDNPIYGGDIFQSGLEFTYNDTYSTLVSQRYIAKYSIYTNENVNINLNMWRFNPNLFKQNFYHIYTQTYGIEWGKHKWINVESSNKYKDFVFINISPKRFNACVDYNKIKSQYGEKLTFICFDESQYARFIEKTHLNINCIKISNFNEFCIAIHSCESFIGNQSMPLALANSIHKDSSIVLIDDLGKILHVGLDENWKNVKYINYTNNTIK